MQIKPRLLLQSALLIVFFCLFRGEWLGMKLEQIFEMWNWQCISPLISPGLQETPWALSNFQQHLPVARFNQCVKRECLKLGSEYCLMDTTQFCEALSRWTMNLPKDRIFRSAQEIWENWGHWWKCLLWTTWFNCKERKCRLCSF